MPALAELEDAWVQARDDPGFRARAGRAAARLRRPPVAAVPGLAPERGRRPPRSTSSARTSTTPAPTRSTTRSARRCSPSGWARRGSSPRPAPASTASPRRPRARCSTSSASSTWAPRTCAARSPTSSGWSCWARRVEPVEAGARTLKEAVSAAIRDWVTNVGATHYIIGSCVGPAPYPALVRDLQRVIGDEARAQMLEREGRLPQRVIACVGGGSNSIGMFVPFVDDAERRAGRRRGRGRGDRDRAPRRAADRRRARPACCTAPTRRSCRTRTARSSRRTRSRPGSTTPAAGPSTPGCATRAAPATSRSPTRRRSTRSPRTDAAGGDHPRARERPRARLGAGQRPGSELDLVCLSGRGDKDLAEALRSSAARDERAPDPRRQPGSSGSPRRSRRARADGRRAALMPYLMGGFPDLDTSRGSALAYADAGADLLELGVPFSDPLADGPVIHAAGTAALRAGATLPGVLEVGRGARRARPGGADVLREPDPRPRPRAVRRRACVEHRRQRADRPRPAARGGAGDARRVRRARARARAAGGADHAGRAAGRGSARRRAASSTPCR